MRIQVLSDIHLEFGSLPSPQTDADVVVAAGDIHVEGGAIDWLKKFDRPVIYVSGNHELWGGCFQRRLQELRELSQGSNIRFLEKNQCTIADVTFYGCTLWCDFKGMSRRIMNESAAMMNDFAYISCDEKPLKPEWLAGYNQDSVRWLNKALGRKTAKKQVVVTHHAPSLRSWGFAPADPLRYAYCNQLDPMIIKRQPALWIHGHVHCHSDYNILDTRVVCNPRGYHPHRLVEAFEPEKILEV